MAIPALIAAAMRAATMLGAEAGGAGAASKIPTLSGWASAAKPPPLPGAPGRAAFEAAQGAKKFGEGLKTVNEQFAFANYNAHAFAHYVQAIPAKFVATATLAIDALAHAAQPFVNLVGRNNPAVTRQWELALNDAYGVLGRSMIPEVQAFTRQARSLGDTMAGLEPVFAPTNQAIARMIDTIGVSLNSAIRDNVVLFQGLAGALRVVADSVTLTLLAMQKAGQVAHWALTLGGLLGGQGKFDPNATSMGAGIRGAKQVGNAEELQNEVIKNALMTGAGETKEDKQVRVLSTLEVAINKLCEFLAKLLANPKAAEQALKEAPANFAKSILSDTTTLFGLLRTS